MSADDLSRIIILASTCTGALMVGSLVLRLISDVIRAGALVHYKRKELELEERRARLTGVPLQSPIPTPGIPQPPMPPFVYQHPGHEVR